VPVLETTTHLDPGALAEQLARDVRAGLTATPKTLPPKYFYDAHGSELFDRITRLPEYYPFRAERTILELHADEIATATGAESLVELGSGTSEKTRLLLRALDEAGTLTGFVPFDVDPAVLKDASAAVAQQFPDLLIEPVVGDFEQHLGLLPQRPRRLVAFLGSTIGNLDPAQRARFLADVRGTLVEGDGLLLGTDLVKDVDRLVAAYDDAQGVTAAFDKNVLTVVNRDLDGHFDPDAFVHVARWNAADERIEMRLRSLREQRVRIDALGLEIAFGRDEELLTEISSKFRRERVEAELAVAGLRLARWWTDPAADYALSLAVPA
jgi:L-histidine N-alpha-methyltransferase